MANANANKNEGLHFEAVLVHRATLTGIWAHKQALSFRYLRAGKILPLRSELDFALINRQGCVCYCDTKSFVGHSFARSALSATQLARSVRYCSYNVPSGFIVYLRGAGLVSFYPGWLIDRAPKGSSFTAEDGRVLGSLQTFTFDAVFAEFKASASP